MEQSIKRSCGHANTRSCAAASLTPQACYVRPSVEKIAPLVDTLRDIYGVGPVCHELDIAPSTYYRHQQHRRHPERRCLREQRDDLQKVEIQRVYDENHRVYGIRKVWRQLLRENIRVARCTVARLMKTEWEPVKGYNSFNEAQSAIIRYITGYYSGIRPHWYNGGLTPNESERLYYIQSNAVASNSWPLHIRSGNT